MKKQITFVAEELGQEVMVAELQGVAEPREDTGAPDPQQLQHLGILLLSIGAGLKIEYIKMVTNKCIPTYCWWVFFKKYPWQEGVGGGGVPPSCLGEGRGGGVIPFY